MKNIFIAAGGTGGHINAALSMGEAFSKDYKVTYLSGTRYLDYQLFKDKNVIHLESRPLRTKNPIRLTINILKNIAVFLQIFFLYLKEKPAFVLGAGGYICGPTLISAKILGNPIFIIEQNAVMGLTNKILARFANLIFTNFKQTKGLEQTSKVKQLGNPIRSKIQTSDLVVSDPIKLLVFGGSLGAEQINNAMTALIKMKIDFKLEILHQVGKGNISQAEYKSENLSYQQCEYIDDMAEKYNWAHIIIARAGASTISELRVVKRPAILIPFPGATDNHQYYNAMELKEEDQFFVEVLDKSLSGDVLASSIHEVINKVVSQKLFYRNENPAENTTEKIKDEIIKYVRD